MVNEKSKREPSNGMKLASAKLVTPGSARPRSSSARMKFRVAVLSYDRGGSVTFIDRTPSGRKPGSIESNFTKL